MEELRAFITAHPILATSLSSLWGAVVIDLVAFSKSKEPGSFFSTFGIKVALWRYVQAFVAGFIGNATIAAGASAVGLLVIYFW